MRQEEVEAKEETAKESVFGSSKHVIDHTNNHFFF